MVTRSRATIERVFGLAATYIGTVIGAGFASGQEIWTFFGRYGFWGLGGLALTVVLFARAGWYAVELGSRLGRENTYYQSLQAFAGRAAPSFDAALLIILCTLGGIMLAGSGALAEELGQPAWLGVVFTACLGSLVVSAGLRGLILVNKIVVPVLLIMASLTASWSLVKPFPLPDTQPFSSAFLWFPSALLYVSYNTVLSLPVLFALGASERDGRVRRLGSKWGAFGLGAAGFLIYAALLARSASASSAEVPMAAIANAIGPMFGSIYVLVLWAEMFTTLIADIYGATSRLRQIFGGSRGLWAVGTMAFGVVLSRFGFARLVRTAYPIFGLLCLAVLIRLLAPIDRTRRNKTVNGTFR